LEFGIQNTSFANRDTAFVGTKLLVRKTVVQHPSSTPDDPAPDQDFNASAVEISPAC
jgi:hypothetical protein